MSLIELELPERLSAPLDIDAFRDLVEQWEWGCVELTMSPPLCLGWDIHRRWPKAEGFAIWRDLMHAYEPPLLVNELPPGSPLWGTTSEKYEAYLVETWAGYDREKHWVDHLIVDEMFSSLERGYVPCGAESVVLRTEAVLDDLAAKVGAKRAAEQDTRDTRHARRRKRLERFYELDDAGYAKWIADGLPFIRSKKGMRWGMRRGQEHLKKKMRSDALTPIPLLPDMPLPDHPNLTVQQAAALEDFYAYLPAHTYIFTPTREFWPATSVNSTIPGILAPMNAKPITAASYLDKHRAVQQMTWAPGRPMLIENKLIADGGWIERPECRIFNLYRAPTIKPKAGDPKPWLDHIKYVYEGEADHIVNWLAHRVQHPDKKINHALVLGGPQGIGKDTLLEPVKAAVGPWNFTEVSPQQMLGRFNGFVKSVVLRVSEARDLGDTDRYGFYEHMKTLTAAPPDVLRVDEKHQREHAVLNVCGVIVTTNNKDSLHLPSDDRRHFVAWSSHKKEDFTDPNYWSAMYRWFGNGGNEIVAHYLANLDLTRFDAKAPPPKTQAFWEMVDSSRAPEDAEMADVLDTLGRPNAITLSAILPRAPFSFQQWLSDVKNRRRIPHRMDECGYVPVRNSSAKDGYWVVNGKRQAVYTRRELSLRDQIEAAACLSAK